MGVDQYRHYIQGNARTGVITKPPGGCEARRAPVPSQTRWAVKKRSRALTRLPVLQLYPMALLARTLRVWILQMVLTQQLALQLQMVLQWLAVLQMVSPFKMILLQIYGLTGWTQMILPSKMVLPIVLQLRFLQQQCVGAHFSGCVFVGTVPVLVRMWIIQAMVVHRQFGTQHVAHSLSCFWTQLLQSAPTWVVPMLRIFTGVCQLYDSHTTL